VLDFAYVDRIIVLHKGQIREMGTHEELLALEGIYYRLHQLQFATQERVAVLKNFSNSYI